jgi:dienelactone hydrolase
MSGPIGAARGSSNGNIIPETQPAILTAVNTSINTNCGGYYQALPARYDSTDIAYPLIVFLHGVGELGDGTSQLENMLKLGLPRLLNQKKLPPEFESGGKHFSFVVIAPQFKQRASADDVQAVIAHARASFRIDASRIYVTGLSLGGGSTWDVAAAYGSSIAAVVPICGGLLPTSDFAQKIASSGVPVWAFHNNDDHVVPAWWTSSFVQLINQFNPPVPARATIWPKGGHDSWTRAYDPDEKESGLDIYQWMLQYKRST